MRERIIYFIKVTIMIGICIIGITSMYKLESKANSSSHNDTSPPDTITSVPVFMDKSAKEGLKEALEYYDIQHPDIVYAQAILETGHFKSAGCLKHNNLFGLYNSKTKRYCRFNHWSESILFYKKCIQNKYFMQETWKDITEYEGLYQISTFGRVKSLAKAGSGGHTSDIIMKLNKDKDGYLLIHLVKDGKRRVHKVHRLVAQEFIPNPDNLPQINHIDEVKSNNYVTNLEWCTQSYNNKFGKGKNNRAITKSKPVIQLSKEGLFIREWSSAKEASVGLNINRQNIVTCCKGRVRSVGGYKWIYKEPPEDYYIFLKRTGYASDPLYTNKLRKIVKYESETGKRDSLGKDSTVTGK